MMMSTTTMIKPKLPIGIQSFEKIRSGGFVYVDKTPFIARMASEAGVFFLSRPRRFGKSLLVDTLDCAFSGKREFFEGLHLDRPESGWDWTKTHPVIRIDFAEGRSDNPTEFKARLHSLIDRWTEQWGARTTKGSPGMRLVDLVRAIHSSTGKQVVVLADEYDKPILDSLSNLEDAIKTREILRDFYGVLKPLDEHLRFALLTGVSKFSKAGIFSGLNNLNDITIDPDFSSICGYTEVDLDHSFAAHCKGFDRDMVRRWYNGYSWGGEGVYNPFDILLLFGKRRFQAWWFETGTPTFLVKLLREQPRTLPDLDGLWIGSELIDSVEPDSMQFEAVLFQTGYLTIKDRTNDAIRGERYRLGFPNLEVRSAFSRLFVETYSGAEAVVPTQRELLWTALEHGDAEALRTVFHAFFASIPHDWYRNNPIRQYEGFYCSVVYGYFASLGLDVIPEDTTNKGRVDLTVKTPWAIWLFEFKVKGLDRSPASDRDPLEQIRSRGYAEKYKVDGPGNPAGVPVKLVGIVFDPETRNFDTWRVEEA